MASRWLAGSGFPALRQGWGRASPPWRPGRDSGTAPQRPPGRHRTLGGSAAPASAPYARDAGGCPGPRCAVGCSWWRSGETRLRGGFASRRLRQSPPRARASGAPRRARLPGRVAARRLRRSRCALTGSAPSWAPTLQPPVSLQLERLMRSNSAAPARRQSSCPTRHSPSQLPVAPHLERGMRSNSAAPSRWHSHGSARTSDPPPGAPRQPREGAPSRGRSAAGRGAPRSDAARGTGPPRRAPGTTSAEATV